MIHDFWILPYGWNWEKFNNQNAPVGLLKIVLGVSSIQPSIIRFLGVFLNLNFQNSKNLFYFFHLAFFLKKNIGKLTFTKNNNKPKAK